MWVINIDQVESLHALLKMYIYEYHGVLYRRNRCEIYCHRNWYVLTYCWASPSVLVMCNLWWCGPDCISQMPHAAYIWEKMAFNIHWTGQERVNVCSYVSLRELSLHLDWACSLAIAHQWLRHIWKNMFPVGWAANFCSLCIYTVSWLSAFKSQGHWVF